MKGDDGFYIDPIPKSDSQPFPLNWGIKSGFDAVFLGGWSCIRHFASGRL